MDLKKRDIAETGIGESAELNEAELGQSLPGAETQELSVEQNPVAEKLTDLINNDQEAGSEATTGELVQAKENLNKILSDIDEQKKQEVEVTGHLFMDSGDIKDVSQFMHMQEGANLIKTVEENNLTLE